MTVKNRDRLALGVLLLAATGVMVAAAGRWVAIVSLVPVSDRPYIGGSQGNSVLECALGYNGFGRLTGDETRSVDRGANGGTWGATGLTRLVDGEIGGQIAWLVPAASAAGAAASAGAASGSRWAAARRRRRSRRGWRRTTPLRRSAAPPSTTSPPKPPPLGPITASAMIGPVPWSEASR